MAKKITGTKLKPIKEKQTSMQIMNHIAAEIGLTRQQVKAVFTSLACLNKRHIMKRGSGEFRIPEMGLRIDRVKKPATPKREGKSPSTGEIMVIPAKPKREVVKLTAFKRLKDIPA